MPAGPRIADLRPQHPGGAGAPNSPVQAKPRRWPVPPLLATAFLISLLFHLSMVTIFRIVVVFPDTRTKYCQVMIVSEKSVPETIAAAPVGGGAIRLGVSELARSLEAKVSLPTINFWEMNRIRVRSEATSGTPGGMAVEPEDSWARFARSLQTFGQSLREMAFSETPSDLVEKPKLTGLHHPASGYDGGILWDGPPLNRELLFSPPVTALANVSSASLHWPVETVITVSPAGRVVNVWCAAVDDAGVIDAIQSMALQYRFAPLPTDLDDAPGVSSTKNQTGTLIIRPAESGP